MEMLSSNTSVWVLWQQIELVDEQTLAKSKVSPLIKDFACLQQDVEAKDIRKLDRRIAGLRDILAGRATTYPSDSEDSDVEARPRRTCRRRRDPIPQDSDGEDCGDDFAEEQDESLRRGPSIRIAVRRLPSASPSPSADRELMEEEEVGLPEISGHENNAGYTISSHEEPVPSGLSWLWHAHSGPPKVSMCFNRTDFNE